MINQNAAHCLGCDGKEVCSVIVGKGLVTEEPDAKFVDESVGLKRMIGAFPLKEAGSDLPQLNLSRFEQPFACAFIAQAPKRKPTCDLTRIRHRLRTRTGK
jgi:hypothetical protein